MSIVITREDIIAYAEVDYIIHHMNEKYIHKIPEKLLNFFDTIKDPTYEVYINPRIPLQNQNLKKYTLELIALLHIKYWCEDEERKKMLYEKMMENQNKLDNQMREKYNMDNMFGFNSAKVVSSLEDIKEYSKPKKVITVENKDATELNAQDYTDNEENELSDSLNMNNAKKEQTMLKKSNFIARFFNKIKNIFSKK